MFRARKISYRANAKLVGENYLCLFQYKKQTEKISNIDVTIYCRDTTVYCDGIELIPLTMHSAYGNITLYSYRKDMFACSIRSIANVQTRQSTAKAKLAVVCGSFEFVRIVRRVVRHAFSCMGTLFGCVFSFAQ